MLIGNALVGQSGGPTSVINNSLAGVIKEVSCSERIGKLLGMHYGVYGLMHEDFIDLGAQSKSLLHELRKTPGAVLGSSRHELSDDDFPKILSIFKKIQLPFSFFNRR